MTIPEGFKLTTGPDRHARTVYTLYKLNSFGFDEDIYIKAWYIDPDDAASQPPTQDEICRECELSDFSRWNTVLPKDQKVEVNEYVYYHMLSALPPRNWGRYHNSYFEDGEPNHLEAGRPIHRAFWMEGDQYYTGHPEKAVESLYDMVCKPVK